MFWGEVKSGRKIITNERDVNVGLRCHNGPQVVNVKTAETQNPSINR
jgi:hypothetical protein